MGNIIIKGGPVPKGKRVEVDKVKLGKNLALYYDKHDVPIEQSMSKESLEQLHKAIHFTHAFKLQESLDKMNEEETLSRHLPT